MVTQLLNCTSYRVPYSGKPLYLHAISCAMSNILMYTVYLPEPQVFSIVSTFTSFITQTKGTCMQILNKSNFSFSLVYHFKVFLRKPTLYHVALF